MVIDEHKEEKGGEDTALGHASVHGQEVRAHSVDDHSLCAARQEAAQPGQERTRDTHAFELVDEA